jgi:GT2 family glycosyltransferase
VTDLAAIAVVTVSFSARMDCLSRQSAMLANETQVREWIVVANGNFDLIEEAAADFALKPRLVRHKTNAGSAIGFGMGIAAALAQPGTRYVLLLDEDNLPEAGATARLLSTLKSESATGARARSVAIAAYRERAHAAQAQGIDIRRPDSSIGFHLADLPGKLLRRLRRQAPKSGRREIATTPYGGLFIERSLLASVAPPSAEFVLYGDDTEFSLRLTKAGVRIILDTSIGIADMDAPPPAKPTLFSFPLWLSIVDDFRFYYGARNEAWLDRHRFARCLAVYRLNRSIVRSVLWLYARGPEKRRRFELFCAASDDGEAGRLGLNPHFPLPQVCP